MYKLQFHIDDHETTYVENVTINNWNEARIVHVKATNGYQMSEEEKDRIAMGFVELAKQNELPLPIIMFGDNLEVEVFVLGEEATPVEGQLKLEFDNVS